MLDIRWSHQEYRARVNPVAKGLMALGLNKGDHIAVWVRGVLSHDGQRQGTKVCAARERY